MLLNAAKCQGHNFYRFGLIKRKPTGVGVVGVSIQIKVIDI